MFTGATVSPTKSLRGGQGADDLATGERNPVALAFDSAGPGGPTLYYANRGDGSIKAILTAEGSSVVPLAPGQGTPTALAFDDTHVYFVNNAAQGAVLRVAKTGGEVETLVDGVPYPAGIAVDVTQVYFTVSANGGVGMGAIMRVAT